MHTSQIATDLHLVAQVLPVVLGVLLFIAVQSAFKL